MFIFGSEIILKSKKSNMNQWSHLEGTDVDSAKSVILRDMPNAKI